MCRRARSKASARYKFVIANSNDEIRIDANTGNHDYNDQYFICTQNPRRIAESHFESAVLDFIRSECA
jgi:hypothetical protein